MKKVIALLLAVLLIVSVAFASGEKPSDDFITCIKELRESFEKSNSEIWSIELSYVEDTNSILMIHSTIMTYDEMKGDMVTFQNDVSELSQSIKEYCELYGNFDATVIGIIITKDRICAGVSIDGVDVSGSLPYSIYS